MSWETLKLFQSSAKYFYRKYREQGGSLDLLANQLNITSTYLSAVINGSRIPSLNLQCHIANVLYGPYDKFIKVGRQLEKGIEPHHDNSEEKETVEKLIARLTHLVMDHKKLTEKLERNEKKFKDISQTTGEMFFEVDRHYTFTYAAGKVYEVTGLSASDALGKKLSDLVDENEWARIEPLLRLSLVRNKVFDEIIITRNGGYIHCAAKPVIAVNEDSFQGLRGSCRDISAGKDLERTAKEDKWFLQSALDAISDSAMVITDDSNKILQWNLASELFFDGPADIRKETYIDDLFACLEEKVDDIAHFRKCLKECLHSPEECVHYFTLKDGKKIKRRTVPLYRDGSYAGKIFFLKDILFFPDIRNIYTTAHRN